MYEPVGLPEEICHIYVQVPLLADIHNYVCTSVVDIGKKVARP
jgi:hypothetical protein